MGRRTRTDTLMKTNDWLNVREMIFYHGAIQIWKMIYTGKPRHLARKLETNVDQEVIITEPRLQFTERTFIYRSSKNWNEIPAETRMIVTISKFKKSLKKWIKDRRNQTPD